jgi:hypothetical protein
MLYDVFTTDAEFVLRAELKTIGRLLDIPKSGLDRIADETVSYGSISEFDTYLVQQAIDASYAEASLKLQRKAIEERVK